MELSEIYNAYGPADQTDPIEGGEKWMYPVIDVKVMSLSSQGLSVSIIELPMVITAPTKGHGVINVTRQMTSI